VQWQPGGKRRSLGTAVLWGALGVTLFGVFLTPVFFYMVDRRTSCPEEEDE
jgi:multidrug efflux pump subunit AcrB